MSLKNTLYILILCLVTYGLSIYYSGKNTSERDYTAMLASGKRDLAIIESYLKHHHQETDVLYDKALSLAAELDVKHLDEIIHYYSIGNLVLDTSSANLILKQLPSDSVPMNYAAGRIYSTNEYNHYNPQKAVTHLEYAALRGDRNAAATLTEIYTRSHCYVEAVTWAKEANKRDTSSECTKLPVNINLLNEKQYDAVLFNEDELDAAQKSERLPNLRYSDQCVIAE